MMRTNINVLIYVILLCKINGKLLRDCSPQDDLPCTLHKFTAADCAPTALQAAFPDIYLTHTASFPGKPGSLAAVSTYRWFEYPGYTGMWMEANLTFTTPQDGSRNYVKGFEVTRYDVLNTISCYILDLSNVTWDQNSLTQMDTEFMLDLFPLPKKYYYFELYTLPKQANKDEKFDKYLSIQINLPVYIPDNNLTASIWRAAIYLYTDYAIGTINVTINPPSPDLGFTEFEYSLVNAISKLIVKTERSAKIWFFFTRVPSGIYKIWVKPFGQCVCKDETGSVCSQCVTTSTTEFEFIYTGPPFVTKPAVTIPTTTPTTRTIPSSTPAGPTINPLELSDTPDGGVSGVQIAMAVVGTSVGLIIAIGLAGVIYYQRCRYTEEETITKPDKPDMNDHPVLPGKNPGYTEDLASIFTFGQVGINNENAEKLKFEKRPKLFLLFEDDHEYHHSVVLQFATYLQQHCQCDVMYVEWQLDAPWVHQDLEQADYVIIVNSEGAYRTYMANYGQKNKSPTQSSPTTKCLSSINSIRNQFLHEERYDNIVMIYFDYTDEQYVLPDICPGYKYKLPKHFTDFLLHVHKLHRTDNLSQYDLPLDGNHNKRDIGQQLLDSIDKACRFQAENPFWAQKRFEYDRMYSHMSDNSQCDSGFPEDPNTPAQTPQVEKCAPFRYSSREADLLQLLEAKSICTINPSDIGFTVHQDNSLSPLAEDTGLSRVSKPRPKLSPQSFNADRTDLHYYNTPSPPTCGTVESEFGFFPPEDLDEDFDILSKTQSEQMKNIVDRYQAANISGNGQNNYISPVDNGPDPMEGNIYTNDDQTEGYDKNRDLFLLKVHSGEVPLIVCNMTGDMVSLGGESV